MSSVGEDEIMSASKCTLPDIEQRGVVDPAAVFSKTTCKIWPAPDFKDIHSLDQIKKLI